MLDTFLAFTLERPSPSDASFWVARLLGATHRLAWTGPDSSGDRVRCRQHLERHLLAAFEGDREARSMSVLVDWWLQGVLGSAPLGTAWRLEEYLPGALVTPLSSIREAYPDKPILGLARPGRFGLAVDELASLLEHAARIKKSPGAEIYVEARQEAQQVLAAARSDDVKPPRAEEFRLLTDDLEDWATETRGTMALDRNLKVWNTLVKHLNYLSDACRDVLDHWHKGPTPQLTISRGLPEMLAQSFPSHRPVAEAIAHDLSRLLGERPKAPLLLKPRWLVDELRDIPEALDITTRVKLLAPVREACQAAPLPLPDWCEEAQTRLQDLRHEVRSLRTLAADLEANDERDQLDVALRELEKLEVGEAEDWIRESERSLTAKAADAETKRVYAEVARKRADLVECGLSDEEPERLPDEAVEPWHARVLEAWEGQRERLEARHQGLVPRATDEESRAALDRAHELLEAGQLGPATRHLQTADSLLESRARELEARLRPEVRELHAEVRHLALRGQEELSAEDLLQRVHACLDADLDVEEVVSSTRSWLESMKVGNSTRELVLAQIQHREGLGRQWKVNLVCWGSTGVRLDNSRWERRSLAVEESVLGEEPDVGALKLLRLSKNWWQQPGPWLDVVEVRQPPPDRFIDVVPCTSLDQVDLTTVQTYPGASDISDTLFFTDGAHVQGPYEVLGSRLVPTDSRGFVARIDVETFDTYFGRFSTSGHRDLERFLVFSPPDLETLLDMEATPVDRLGAQEVEVWLAGLMEDVEDVELSRVASAIERLNARGEGLPGAILEQRLQHLQRFLEISQHFERERKRAAELFLDTEEGGREVKRAADRRVELELEAVHRKVEIEKAELDRKLGAKAEQVLDLEKRLASLQEQEEEERKQLDSRLAFLREQITQLEGLRQDAKAQVLLELMGSVQGASPGRASPTPTSDSREPLRSTPCHGRPITALDQLVGELAIHLDMWSERDVANLLVTVLTNPWTLVAGPPGVGKSTFVRSLWTRLGHGPSTDRYLELVVRRDWQDDTPLFGFWHPEQDRWVPSSEGFVEHLLKADDDHAQQHGGLYPCVVEELNLASPEYYLARPISALEDPHPVVRLYGEDLAPANAARYPARIPIAPGVRLLATVNVDDTVERLSPRFLSRSSVLWMSPSLENLTRAPSVIEPPEEPVDGASLLALALREPAPADDLVKVARLLHNHRVPGAPTPRTLRGIERYLAVAKDVLPEKVAQDYQVLQRILPCIHGVGERYRAILDELTALLRANQWRMSADRCEQLRARGEELGDYYDFFHA